MKERINIILQTMLQSGIIGASFSYSFMLAVIPFLAGRIKPASEETSQEDYIAAVALSITMLSMVAAVSYSGLYSMGMIVSNAYGKLKSAENNSHSTNDGPAPVPEASVAELKAEIEHTLHAGLLSSAIIAIPATTILYFSGDILTACGQQPQIAALAQDFLRPYAFAMPPLLWRICLESVGLSFKQRLPFMAMALPNFGIGTALAYLLCFGYLTPKPLELAGIAYGYLIESYLTCGSFALFLAKAKIFADYHFFKHFSGGASTREKIIAIFQRGWTIALTFGVESATMWALSVFAGLLGTDQQAALGLCNQFYFFAIIFILASGQYNTQEIADAIGNQNYADAILKARYGLLATNLLLLPGCILVAAYPEVLQFITTNAELNANIMQMLIILGPLTALMVLADATGYGMLTALRSMQEVPADNFRTNLMPTFVSVLSTALGLMLAYVLGLHTDWGIYGIAVGYALGLTLRAGGLAALWVRETHLIQAKITPADELQPLLLRTANDPPQNSCWPTPPLSCFSLTC